MSKPELAMWATEGTGRSYKHPFREVAPGKPLISPSITTVLKYENKDNLIQWAANLTLMWCIENWSLLGQRSTEDATKSGRYRWKDVRDERAEVGTGVHESVEAIHTGSWEFPELDDEQKLIMLEFDALNEEWEIEPILTEFTVWNLEHDYAGTGDGLWRMTNRTSGETLVALIDLKTSKNTWPGHWMQLSALMNGQYLMSKDADGNWIELPMPKFDNAALIHLRAPYWDDKLKAMQPGKHDVIFADQEKMGIRFEQFVAYRKIWGTEESLKEIDKRRENEF